MKGKSRFAELYKLKEKIPAGKTHAQTSEEEVPPGCTYYFWESMLEFPLGVFKESEGNYFCSSFSNKSKPTRKGPLCLPPVLQSPPSVSYLLNLSEAIWQGNLEDVVWRFPGPASQAESRNVGLDLRQWENNWYV